MLQQETQMDSVTPPISTGLEAWVYFRCEWRQITLRMAMAPRCPYLLQSITTLVFVESWPQVEVHSISSPFSNLLFPYKITKGAVTLYAGAKQSPGRGDGTLTSARFGNLMGLVIDDDGTIFVSDYAFHSIRVISSTGSPLLSYYCLKTNGISVIRQVLFPPWLEARRDLMVMWMASGHAPYLTTLTTSRWPQLARSTLQIMETEEFELLTSQNVSFNELRVVSGWHVTDTVCEQAMSPLLSGQTLTLLMVLAAMRLFMLHMESRLIPWVMHMSLKTLQILCARFRLLLLWQR